MKYIKKILFSLVAGISLLYADNIIAGSISIYSSNNVVVVGNSVTVTVKVSSDVEAWDFTIGYDTSKLRLTSSTMESGATKSVSTSTMMPSRTYTLKFKALNSGTTSIYVNDADCAGVSCSKGSKSLTLKTQEEIEASYSKNNYLSSLTVEGVELNPAFNKETLEYSIELAPETPKVNISASVEDSKSSVEGTGEREVSEGDNRLEINVTAQNGSKRTYVINAKVKEYNPIEIDYNGSKYTVVRKKSQLTAPNNYTETTVKFNEEEVPAFTSEITKFVLIGLKDSDGNINLYIYDEKGKTYTLYKEYGFSKVVLFPMELKEIPKNYHKTKITYNDQEIIAYKTNDKSNYALIYGMNVETGKINTYMYDSVEDTLQIYNTEEVDLLNEQIEQMGKLILAIGIVVIILIIVIFICIIKIINKNKNIPYDSKHGKNKKELKKEKKEQKKMDKIEDDEISVTAIKKTF